MFTYIYRYCEYYNTHLQILYIYVYDTDLWVGKIPWRAWQSTPVFLPGDPHGQRSLAGYSHKDLHTTEAAWHAHKHSVNTSSHQPLRKPPDVKKSLICFCEE